jgi:antitoxin component YwqK of YwqJK toxin-antitoxin module
MNNARGDRPSGNGRLFWTFFTLVAIVWVVTVFAVSMMWQSPGRPSPEAVSGADAAAPGAPAAGTPGRFKTAVMTGDNPDRNLYRHEEYYPESGRRKSSEEIYHDERLSPIRHGQMTVWYENGGKQCEGRWHDGRKVGPWLAWHENGQVWVRGEFADDKPLGKWQYFDERGRPCGQRDEGLKTGEWREWNRQRDTLGSGRYIDDVQDGTWLFQNAQGQTVLEVTYRQGVIDGPAVVHQPVRVEYFVENNQELRSRRRLALDGRFYSGDDPTTGETVAAFASPRFTDLQWVPLDGPFDPELRVTDEQSWHDGRPKSKLVCKVIAEGGRIVRVPHGEARSWYPNERLHREQSYLDGLPHGVFREWYDDGQLKYEVEFHLGQPAGTWKFWHQDGRKQAEGTIRPGLAKEHWAFWNADGSRAATPDVWDWITTRSPLAMEAGPPLPANAAP